MRFLILGTGGIGGCFGIRLALSGADVRFVARGRHAAKIRRDGLTLRGPDQLLHLPKPFVTEHPGDAGPVDVVLHCVKTYDLDEATRQLLPALTDSSIIISLQNGIDNEERIRGILPHGIMYGGVAYVYATLTAPGEITEAAGPRKIVYGPMDGQTTATTQRIFETFQRAGISAEIPAHIQTELWKKFVFITAVGGITALTRLTLGEILAVEETRRLLLAAMREPESIARIQGLPLPADLIDSFFEIMARFQNDTRSSLHYDLVHDRPLELESLSGAVIRLGAAHRFPTPVHGMIYAALLPYHLRAMTRRSRS